MTDVEVIARVESAVRRQGSFVLGPLSLDLPAGCWTSLSGRSGAGKTTLLQLFGGLDRLQEGRLELFGEDVTRASDGRVAALRRAQVGIVLQDHRLIEHLTAWENVTVRLVPLGAPARERRERAAETLAALEVEHALDRRPAQLSGGERQRVAVARALILNPRLILADEPTGAVDEATGARIIEALGARRDAGSALLVSSHDPSALGAGDVQRKLVEGELRS